MRPPTAPQPASGSSLARARDKASTLTKPRASAIAPGRMSEAAAGYGRRMVLDNSAWSRILLGRLSEDDHARWEAAVRADEILICEPFRLEALYSAQTASDYDEIAAELDAFEQVSSDGLLARVLRAQAALAANRAVSHRVKIVDLIVAAAAEVAGAGVLHYDKDFDLIAEHGGVHFTSAWIAPRGSAEQVETHPLVEP